MRYRITLILIAIISFSCSRKDENLTINLNVSNYSKDYLIFAKDTLGYELSVTTDTIWINTDGNFKITTKHLKSKSLILLEDSTNIRLTIPKTLNSNITFKVDMLRPDSVEVFGKQALFIRYFQDQQKYWEKIYYEMIDKHKAFAKGNKRSHVYHAVQDTITELRMQFLINYFNNSNIESKQEFIDDEYNSLLYSNLFYRMSGQDNGIINSLFFYHQSEENGNNVITYSDKVDFSNKDLLSISSFKRFVNEFIMSAVRVENPKGDFSSFEFYLHNGLIVIDTWFKEPHINTLYKIVFVDYLVETAKIFKGKLNVYEFQIVIENLRKHEFAEPYLDILDYKLHETNKLLVKLSPGVNAPDFELHDEYGEIYKLSDFENELLIIDVWASWCSNCVATFPKWNSLIDKYSINKNIHFVSVCADDNQNKWYKTIQKYKPKGKHLYVGTKGFDSKFIKSFEIVAIPQYIIIDKESKIISITTSIMDVEKALENIK